MTDTDEYRMFHDPHRHVDRGLVDQVMQVITETLGPPAQEESHYRVFWTKKPIYLRVHDKGGLRRISSWGFARPIGGFECGLHKEAAQAGNHKLWQFLVDRGIEPCTVPPTRGIHIWREERMNFEEYPILRRFYSECDVIAADLACACEMRDWTGIIMAMSDAESETRTFMEDQARLEEKYGNSDGHGMCWPGHNLTTIQGIRDKIAWELRNPSRFSLEGLKPEHLRALWILAHSAREPSFLSANDAPVNPEILDRVQIGKHSFYVPTPHVMSAATMIPDEAIWSKPIGYAQWIIRNEGRNVTELAYLKQKIQAHAWNTPWDNQLRAEYTRMLDNLGSQPSIQPARAVPQQGLFSLEDL